MELVMTQTVTIPSLSEADKIIRAERYYIGQGVTRRVYYRPGDYWAYKVVHDAVHDDSNSMEYENGIYFRSMLPAPIRIPEMHLLSNGILAVQYIHGEGPHSFDEQCSCQNTVLGRCVYDIVDFLSDVHEGNIIISKNEIWLIDLGGESSIIMERRIKRQFSRMVQA